MVKIEESKNPKKTERRKATYKRTGEKEIKQKPACCCKNLKIINIHAENGKIYTTYKCMYCLYQVTIGVKIPE